jgi:hypothetical protein
MHAGVLLVLSLVYLLYLPRADFSNGFEWIAGSVLIAGVLAQSGGFFLHRGVGQAGKPSAGTKLTRIGAFLIGAALVSPAVGRSRRLSDARRSPADADLSLARSRLPVLGRARRRCDPREPDWPHEE